MRLLLFDGPELNDITVVLQTAWRACEDPGSHPGPHPGPPVPSIARALSPTPEHGLGVLVLPVSDVDKAKDFYQALNWRLDTSYSGGPGYRAAQLTPPGSASSVMLGTGVSSATSG
jgi:hypothetical protein